MVMQVQNINLYKLDKCLIISMKNIDKCPQICTPNKDTLNTKMINDIK